MKLSQPLTVVIRIPNVALSRSDLDTSLKLQVDRYEPSSRLAYAQIDNGDHEDQWAALLDLIRSIGAVIPGLLAKGEIGRPSVDVAMVFPDSLMAKYLTIPADVVAAAGEAGMGIEVSVYRGE
ncbi:hypothetical protein [Bradyrhizobium liaoningense]|uniref:hypothetical protein n=1 Tax=Bradyrhizobium TaxID=374 RepID=UPI001BAA1A19|nr:hypothetical protein [Bradyrhizobium liaoningense]MBR1171762.1 hypothetical protein [Bradyrhizobium liaoningense]